MTDLHCGGKRQAVLFVDEGYIEFKCNSRVCKGEYGPGIVVLHRFSLSSGDLLETKRFKDPVAKGR